MNLDKSPYIIAEIGNNHDGDFNKAKDLVYAAKEAGVNSVKFQCIDYEKWISAELPTFKRALSSGMRSQLERLKAIELSIDQYIELAKLCKKLSLDFGCTIFDKKILKALENYLSYRKISSGEIFNIDTINLHKDSNVPIIISTGLARDFSDIENALSLLSENNFYILHCVSCYPLPIENASMTNITLLHKKYGIDKVGYSDHTVGLEACSFALALGCKVIEKHFKLNEDSDIGDKPLSSDPSEMSKLVQIAKNWTAKENNLLSLGWESDSKNQLIRKAHTYIDLEPGTLLTKENCKFIISGRGDLNSFDVEKMNYLTKTFIPKDKPIYLKDIIKS